MLHFIFQTLVLVGNRSIADCFIILCGAITDDNVVPLIWLLVLFLIDPNMSFKIGDMNFASYFNHRSSWPRKGKFLVVSKTKILFNRDIGLSVCDNIL